MIAFLLCLLPWSFAAKVDVPWLPTRYAVFSVGFTFVSLCMAHAFQKAHATDDLIISSSVLEDSSSLSFPLEANFWKHEGWLHPWEVQHSILQAQQWNQGDPHTNEVFLDSGLKQKDERRRYKNYKNVLPTSGWCERSEWLVCWVALAWSQWLGFQWGSTDRDSAELAEEMLQSKHLVLKSSIASAPRIHLLFAGLTMIPWLVAFAVRCYSGCPPCRSAKDRVDPCNTKYSIIRRRQATWSNCFVRCWLTSKIVSIAFWES